MKLVDVGLIDVGERTETCHDSFLLEDIQVRGVVQPLTVESRGERYTLVDGLHRLACAKALGIKQVPVQIVRRWR